MNTRHRRQGFTLIELLVVIAIIGVLVGLLLPAINAARESGRRTQCLNNQRQVGLGVQGYINAKNTFPNSVTWDVFPDFESNIMAPHPMTLNGNTVTVAPRHSWVVDILPYIEQQALYNDFNRERMYYDTTVSGGTTNNFTVSSTGIGILTCPNDDTALRDQGNLSYVCNSGFNLYWYSFNGWDSQVATPGTERGGSAAGVMDWDKATNSAATVGGVVARRTGVMWPGTLDGRTPWDYKTNVSAVTDGSSTTLLLTENTLAGAHPGGSYSSDGGNNPIPTNWACAHPNFVAFMGSDDVCTGGSTTHCFGNAGLAPIPGTRVKTGSAWSYANRTGGGESINSGTRDGAQEGQFPFPNSLHPGIIVVTMCDGSTKVISDSIDGIVWAKLITPAGGNLPPVYRQTPVSQDEISN